MLSLVITAGTGGAMGEGGLSFRHINFKERKKRSLLYFHIPNWLFFLEVEPSFQKKKKNLIPNPQCIKQVKIVIYCYKSHLGG